LFQSLLLSINTSHSTIDDNAQAIWLLDLFHFTDSCGAAGCWLLHEGTSVICSGTWWCLSRTTNFARAQTGLVEVLRSFIRHEDLAG